jgi:hypothetical protein
MAFIARNNIDEAPPPDVFIRTYLWIPRTRISYSTYRWEIQLIYTIAPDPAAAM